jgi:hypothetical protein
MIYPLRIKGEEYPLSKGDIVVCITEHFQEFTFGKQYKLYSNVASFPAHMPALNRANIGKVGSLLPITSDLGNHTLPAYYSPTGYYFLPLDVWRELKINKVLEK